MDLDFLGLFWKEKLLSYNRVNSVAIPRKSVVRLTDCPDMTLDVYRGRKTTMQQQCSNKMMKVYH